MNLTHLWIELLQGVLAISLANFFLIAVGAALILTGALARRYTFVLLPVGFGLILANFGAFSPNGTFGFLYSWGVASNVFPLLAVAGLGAMTDFRPLLANPRLLFAALPMLVGIFVSFILAGSLRFPLQSAASIALIASLDSPAAIFTANTLDPGLVSPVGFAALLLPLIALWAASRVAAGPLVPADASPEEASFGQAVSAPAARLIFALAIVGAIGLFFRPALPLAVAFFLGNLLQPDQDRPFRFHGLAWTITQVGLVLTGLVVGSSLVDARFFTPQALKAFLIALVGLVVSLLGFWLLFRQMARKTPALFAPEQRRQLVVGSLTAIELVGLIFTCILVTVTGLLG